MIPAPEHGYAVVLTLTEGEARLVARVLEYVRNTDVDYVRFGVDGHQLCRRIADDIMARLRRREA